MAARSSSLMQEHTLSLTLSPFLPVRKWSERHGVSFQVVVLRSKTSPTRSLLSVSVHLDHPGSWRSATLYFQQLVVSNALFDAKKWMLNPVPIHIAAKGAIVVEWNIKEGTKGSAGMWDSHIRYLSSFDFASSDTNGRVQTRWRFVLNSPYREIFSRPFYSCWNKSRSIAM